MHDLFGNIARLIDSTKQTAMAATYTPYGEEIFSGLASPWRFASKRIDPETKLIHFGRRFYDPESARFITPDPKGFTSGLNLYLYVSNDPLHQFDLYGLESKNNESSFGENLLTISLATTYSASEVCIDYFPVFFAADMLTYGWNYIIESTRWGWIKKDWRIATLPTENVKSRTINKLFSAESRKGELFSKTYGDIHGGIEKGIILGSLGSLGVKKIFSRNAARYFEKYALNKEAEFLGKIKISQIAAETEAVAEEKMLESLALKPDKVAEIEKMIESYLGEGTLMRRNNFGDLVFLSQDGLRRVRFDFIRPSPHNNPHMHVDLKIENKWIESRIYPIDVPHN
ncbi:MAG: RHS repeat-associated core domain-containing protein [Parachlamydiales bacterium]|nr:RHS repeat-associated core domain-containing protein [Parachlamydiales bacterium]